MSKKTKSTLMALLRVAVAMTIFVLAVRYYDELKNIDVRAGWLMVPYLLWVTFAGYLNMMIYILN